MKNTVNISRELWDDIDFRDDEFSQREAWIWMIAQAAWKPREYRLGSTVVSLQRGQLAVSVRYLAERFGWHRSRVSRYFSMLQRCSKIETRTETGVTVVTICKYDEYQFKRSDAETPAETPPRQDRDTTETKHKQENNKTGFKDSMSGRTPDDDPEFVELWSSWTLKGRQRSSKKKSFEALSRARKRHGFGAVITGARIYLKTDDCARSGGQGLHVWLNDERFLSFAEQARPRPIPSSSTDLRSLGVAT